MKKLLKILLILIFSLLVGVFSINAYATEYSLTPSYTISEEEGALVLLKNGEEIKRTSSIKEIVSELEDGANLYFDKLTLNESFTLNSDELTVSGTLMLIDGASLVIDGGSVALKELSLTLDSGAVRVKRGTLSLYSGSIRSAGVAVTLDFSASSFFNMYGGSVYSDGEYALELLRGSTTVCGGYIECSGGAAINNSSSLSLYLSPSIKGDGYDILTSCEITLFGSGSVYEGSTRVKFLGEFPLGEATAAFYTNSESSLSGISLFDKNGEKMPLKYYNGGELSFDEGVGAVYRPYIISLKYKDSIISTVEYIKGIEPTLPTPPAQLGYTFVGWYTASGEMYDSASELASNITLYAKYKLTTPTFNLFYESFTYDGTDRYISVENISHPLLESGYISYEWYKDGGKLSSYSERHRVRDVSDSGEYYVAISFTVGQDSVSVSTPPFNLTIKKASVAPPEIPEKTYTGSPITPEIEENGIYTAEKITPTLSGVYSIKLTLSDSKNYEFSSTDKEYIYVDFVIKRAENSWLSLPSVRDIYTSENLSPAAVSLFGEVKFLFSESGDTIFTDAVPNTAGEYLMRAVVVGNENYTSLESEPVLFKIIEEVAVGISVKNPPDKVEYTAFELFSPDGIVVEVAYNSGRCLSVSADKLSFEYQKADSFRYGDGGITVSYLGCSVMLPVSVSRASYDISGVVFSDMSCVYDGTQKSIPTPESLPVGLDNIPLTARIEGGGIDAGVYTIYLHFSTESESYNAPESLTAKLTITPLMCEVIWDNLEFVYDKTVKTPTAFFHDIHKRKISLTVEGGRSLAGVYTAEARYDGKNYSLINPETSYEIKKADYDMSGVSWVGGGYIYDGEAKAVYIQSLPDGVEVTGYINNKATNAGEYTAVAIFSYDEDNYNKPSAPEYLWQIAKREYPLSDFSFADSSVIFDGQDHYPLLSGEMPIGIDGVPLEYSFSRGVCHVSEGRVRVEISFSTASRNYLIPPQSYAYVSILPREIYVVWEGLELIYTGLPQAPRATAKETAVSVSTYGVGAGEYKTVATADNSDYKIINSVAEFVIKKAENAFTKGPSVSDIFYGREPNVTAECLAGKISYRYYSDEGCKTELADVPRAVGRYYLVISCEGDSNHLPISSPVLSFEIIAVVPIALEGRLNREYFSALDTIGEGDISLTLSYNDGTKRPLSIQDARLIYEKGDSFLYGDSSVVVSYQELSLKIDVDVRLAKYDLSNILWKNTLQIYDGMAKSAYLTGLPDGIVVTEYIGNGGIMAGEYTVSAKIEYDRENYSEPEIPTATLVIAKRVVETPFIPSKVYNGEIQMPVLTESLLYTYHFEGNPSVAGAYPVKYALVDKENYTFANGSDEISVNYVIEKRVLNITVSSVVLYLFENNYEGDYTLDSGSLLAGDTLMPTYREENGLLYVSFEGLDNYDIRVTPGKVERVNRLSPSMSLLLFIVIIIAIILILFAYLALKKRSYSYISSRGAIMRLPTLNGEGSESGVTNAPTEAASEPIPPLEEPINADAPSEEEGCDADEPIPPPEEPISDDAPSEEEIFDADEPIPPEELPVSEGEATPTECEDDMPIPPPEIPIEPDSSIADRIVGSAGAISVEYADEAITNSTARDLLRRDEVIVTEGSRRGIINVDTLSRSFSAGDRVDINILKEHRLIPYDTSYIKVLARGIIDKPLTVYANDFSLSAIKMIVLSGGKAVRANTYSITKKGKSS